MRNPFIKYLFFLWTLLIGVSSQANGFSLSNSSTISPIERNEIADYQASVVASNIHALKSTLIFVPIELFAADIEEEIEEIETHKKHQSVQNCINRPSHSYSVSYSNHSSYNLANQHLKDYKRYLLNCVYLL